MDPLIAQARTLLEGQIVPNPLLSPQNLRQPPLTLPQQDFQGQKKTELITSLVLAGTGVSIAPSLPLSQIAHLK